MRCVGHLSDALDVSSPRQAKDWNNQMQATLVLVVETTNEQSISFVFEQLDTSVVAPGEPVNGIGCGASHARHSYATAAGTASSARATTERNEPSKEIIMGFILLWLLGIPIPILILLALLHH